MSMYTKTVSRGFALIEMILYVALAAIILYSVSVLYDVVIVNQLRNEARSSVDESSAHALRVITDLIRRAEDIEEPGRQSMGGELILHMSDPAVDPTRIFLTYDSIMIKEGSHDPIAITSFDTIVSGLTFENLSENDVSDSVRVQFESQYRQIATRSETEYSNIYYASATTR